LKIIEERKRRAKLKFFTEFEKCAVHAIANNGYKRKDNINLPYEVEPLPQLQ